VFGGERDEWLAVYESFDERGVEGAAGTAKPAVVLPRP
jgi:hypothetical protein